MIIVTLIFANCFLPARGNALIGRTDEFMSPRYASLCNHLELCFMIMT